MKGKRIRQSREVVKSEAMVVVTEALSPAQNITTISHFPPNPKSLILQQCKTRRDLNQIHARLIKNRLILNPSVLENLLESAAIILPDSMDYALSIFHGIDRIDSSAYNVIIRGFTSKQSHQDAILMFKQMGESSVRPNEFTFSSVFKACSRLGSLDVGEQVHAHMLKRGYQLNEFVANALIGMYASGGQIHIARRVFDGMSERGSVAWNSMFSGYARNGRWEEIVKLFGEMRLRDVGFDEVTLLSVLNACGRLANLGLGKWISNYINKNGLSRNLNLMTSLLNMYAKCGEVEAAERLFDQLECKDVVAWSAMISGYIQANRCKEALDLFSEMQKAGVDPNEVTMVSVLYACAVLGALETGKWVHSYVKKKKMKLTVTLGTALVDFYAKCGCVDNSIEVFNEMPLKNVFSWTAVIQGLASNGEGKRALEFFHLMRENYIEPNDVTFIGVLSACSHAGLVNEARTFFVNMSKEFGVELRIEHYGCMVDVLARVGLIDEAFQFIIDMPVEPNAIIWRTLLASCKAHKNVPIGEESFKQINELEPAHSGDYILLSNIYASAGRTQDAMRIRNEMREIGIKKRAPGCSLIELEGVVHEFFSADDGHSHSKEIYRATEEMLERIRLAGYEPNVGDARIDAEEEEHKETSISQHSEKLAIAFGLIQTPPGATIRITKNLRVCIDCHNATKVISKVFNREIIVRDRNRFHHFKEGSCSCNDYW